MAQPGKWIDFLQRVFIFVPHLQKNNTQDELGQASGKWTGQNNNSIKPQMP